MIEIHGAQEIATRLDTVAELVDSIIPIKTTRVVLNLLGAFLSLALMVNMTAEAGFIGLKPLLRLVQRCSLGSLSLSMFMRSATPLVAMGKHNALIGLVTTGSIVVLFAASLVLVAMNPEHQKK